MKKICLDITFESSRFSNWKYDPSQAPVSQAEVAFKMVFTWERLQKSSDL